VNNPLANQLNASGSGLLIARRVCTPGAVQNAILGVIDALTPAGRELVCELSAALFATEVDEAQDKLASAILGNFLRPEMSAFEKAIHEAYAMGLQLGP